MIVLVQYTELRKTNKKRKIKAALDRSFINLLRKKYKKLLVNIYYKSITIRLLVLINITNHSLTIHNITRFYINNY